MIKKDRIDILNMDIKKMKSVIDNYPIIRLYQENIWNNNYDWEELLLSLDNLKENTLYIRLDEYEIYKNHLCGFNVQYLI